MKKRYFALALCTLFTIIQFSCSDSDDDYVPVSPVTVDLTLVPYQKLSDYKFFEGPLKDQKPALNVIPYAPISSLFTDYASKKRFIWLPNGVMADYVADDKILDLPVGAALIKTFYYTTIQPNNTTKIIETRLMIRKADGWKFYEYIWNEDQTDAELLSGPDFLNGTFKTITFKKPNGETVTTDYRIPSDAECLACHKINEVPTPIGIKPQLLNYTYNYGNQNRNILRKLVDQGYLDTYPTNIATAVDYRDTTKSLDLRARSYLDINCAHCHQDDARCSYRPIRLGFGLSNIDSNIGICLDADEPLSPSLLKIITPGNFNKSVLHYRINSNDESIRMPMFGRTMVHEEGVALIRDYISSLTQTCN